MQKIDEIENLVKIISKLPGLGPKSAKRIISKVGELNNPADRDHCLQYMVAIGLLKGDLVAEDYEDEVAQDPRILKPVPTVNLPSAIILPSLRRITRFVSGIILSILFVV